jgi:hypothetical protein
LPWLQLVRCRIGIESGVGEAGDAVEQPFTPRLVAKTD